jgi:hypothetical protein
MLRGVGDESAYKPDSVSTEVEGDHPSRAAVADSLMRPTCEHRAGRSFAQALRPSWSCSRRGLPSRHGHPWRWWSLTPPFHPYQDCSWRSVLCGTVPRVAPGGRYPPPCPVESGLSSTLACRDHPADSSAEQATRIWATRSTHGCGSPSRVRGSTVPDRRQPSTREARTKNGFAPKICQACERPMEWRKAWAANWDSVKYCSEKCRRA